MRGHDLRRLVLDDGDRSLALDTVKDEADEVGEPPYGQSRPTVRPLPRGRWQPHLAVRQPFLGGHGERTSRRQCR